MTDEDDLTLAHGAAFQGGTERKRIEDGALILFSHGEEPREPFEEGREILVFLPDGNAATLCSSPSHGPTHVEWSTPSRMRIIFPLKRISPGVWKIHFEESHKGILDMGSSPRA